jgi:hypothetical protein
MIEFSRLHVATEKLTSRYFRKTRRSRGLLGKLVVASIWATHCHTHDACHGIDDPLGGPGCDPRARCGSTWRQFVRAHAGAILTTDLFTFHTVLLGTLYVLVFLELRARRVVLANCTVHPESAWVTQQTRNTAT